MSVLINKLAELTEGDAKNLNISTVLEDLEAWDSLTKVSFMVFATTEYGVQVTGSELEEANTIGDLEKLILEKKKDEG